MGHQLKLKWIYSSVINVCCCVAVVLVLSCSVVAGQTSPAPNTQNVCNRDPPGTTASKTIGDNGFRIKIAGNPQPEKYTPGQVYTVTINSTFPDQKLLGFMLVAVPLNAKDDESTAMGVFQHMNNGLTKFAEECEYVVTHSYRHKKSGVEVLWTAPPAGTGCIEFRATVIEHTDIWYKNDGALTKVFCEDSGLTENNQAPELIPDCCACGTGKYQMTFHGVWTHRSHPRDYPTHKNLLHWSNIVGASHGKNYMIWKYGGYASKGVKEVCQFGYSRSLEEEMREYSRDVRTVIKTPGIWWADPHGLEQTRWARFSVDKTNHLLSMLTMLGPSPDWCVGVSALDLCLPNCTWAGDQTIELYPWDAGTDDGITYMSANMKSDPQQKIHRITNTFPNNPNSPFYGREPIRPLALLKLRRIHPKPDEAPCVPGSESEYEDEPEEVGGAGIGEVEGDMDGDGVLSEMEKQKLMMMKQAQMGKCGVSDWADWSSCSVTCGVGQRFRKRMYLNPMVDEAMCGLPLMDTENCIGIENQCESLDQPCAVTSWSFWSPCSVTCGKGMRERKRYYMRKEDMVSGNCTRRTEDQEVCMADILDCSKALAMKNFTAICSLERDVGPCRGSFTRWYYDTDMQKCLRFIYGGCRGNNNRFSTEEECMDMCVNRNPEEDDNNETPRDEMEKGKHNNNKENKDKEEKDDKKSKNKDRRNKKKNKNKDSDNSEKSRAVNCLMSPWSEWSECSATCGSAYKYKRRMVKREPENGGRKCPKKVEKKKRCEVPKCSEKKSSRAGSEDDCQVSSWSDWSVCSASCGRGYKYKRRMIQRPARNGGKSCPKKLERARLCTLPPCTEDCGLGEWGEWTPCAKTCGEDSIQERTRAILVPSRRQNHDCGSRIQRRYCDLPPCPQYRKNRHGAHES